MGIYGQYLDDPVLSQNFDQLTAERKKQLKRISNLRGNTDVLVVAADLNKGQAAGHLIALGYADLLPITDQLANLKGKKLDVILETPGGSGETAEEIVRICRKRYEEISVIVPGWAKSAGTILAMAADEIVMGPASALGPIDAQISWQGKQFSADALIEGMEKIKLEVEKTGSLNRAYIPILQGISPGELQSAQNALNFAKVLVTDWLARYKFKNWSTHSSTGLPVTDAERKARAEEVAERLCDHRHWLTHGRSIKIQDLTEMRLKITDYSENGELNDATTRYYTLLQMTFATNIYKVFETTDSQIYRFIAPQLPPPSQILQQLQPHPGSTAMVVFDVQCNRCKATCKIQANLLPNQVLQRDCIPFPRDNKFACPGCGVEIDLTDVRRQIEAQTKKTVVL